MASKVELYDNGVLVGTDNAPVTTGDTVTFSIDYSPTDPSDSLVAKYFIDGVLQGESAVRNVTVNAASELDPLVVPYMTASGYANDGTLYFSGTPQQITGSQYATHLDTLVKSLKTATGVTDLSTVFNAIYPKHGNSLNMVKFNLLNPDDTDTAKRLTFFGVHAFTPAGHYHTGSSATGTNVKGNYWNTHIIPDNEMIMTGRGAIMAISTDVTPSTYNDYLLSCRTDLNVNTDGGSFALRIGDNRITTGTLDGGTVTIPDEPLMGIYGLVEGSAGAGLFKNGTKRGSIAQGTFNGMPEAEIRCGSDFQGGLNGAEKDYELSAQTHLSEAYIKGSLTDQQILDVMAAIDTFEAGINRKTW